MWSRTIKLPTRFETHLKLLLRKEKHLPSVSTVCLKLQVRTPHHRHTAACVTGHRLNTYYLQSELDSSNPTRLASPFRNIQSIKLVRITPNTLECKQLMDMECGCKMKREKERQEREALNMAEQCFRNQDNQEKDQNKRLVMDSSTTSALQSSFHRRHLPQDCIAFSSPDGRKLFTEAINCSTNYMQIYFPLAEQFITQAEPAFCGLATLAMCLNALQIDPGRLWKGPWRWFSEELFDCCTSLSVAKEKGISLSEFICLARCNGVITEDYRATSDFTLEQFREIVKHSCATSSEIVVLNYSRKVLGQTGDGHFSPIGGYHAEKDMVLLMDVARFKYPPHWVKISRVFESMQLIDPSMDLPRGLAVLKIPVVPAPQPCCYSSSSIESMRCMTDFTLTAQR
ncbi:glutathione gamma [Plasmopara halstedii]|uniref:glutathione gamma-glutamylcysteinyltransferase n=1 Tax=Plasmopara halstedii TaxID=4781 RepID=A0A0P1AXD8_PLAHL|nr:glutathione gamma [Plasmopara halstedii]CEG46925.1 glutathione gamma [Plasmopara halstedii]|eukprot:XP_024583294.1 glutathione gamma [Plasmopara halstedii]